jgi:hypothetical protein
MIWSPWLEMKQLPLINCSPARQGDTTERQFVHSAMRQVSGRSTREAAVKSARPTTRSAGVVLVFSTTTAATPGVSFVTTQVAAVPLTSVLPMLKVRLVAPVTQLASI